MKIRKLNKFLSNVKKEKKSLVKFDPLKMILHNKTRQRYEGHSGIIDTILPRTKTKDLLINLRSNYSEVFPVRVGSFFRPFEPRPKGKKSTFERNLNVALTPSSTSLRVRTSLPCVLSLNFENRGE